MKSKILSASLIWENMKKQIWMLAIIFLGLLMVYPVSTFVAFDEWNRYLGSYPEILERYLYFIKFTLSRTGLLFLIAAALLNGIFGFSWLHSKQKVDFYHSLPIRREKLFWNQAVTGVVFYAVPEILASLLCLCIGASKGYFTMELVGTMAVTAALHILFYLMAYGTTILAMMLTGRILVGILGAGAFLIYIPGVAYLLSQYSKVFFTTYLQGYDLSTLSKSVAAYGSPAVWYLRLSRQMEIDGRMLPLAVIAAVVFCIVVFILNLWLYKIRPSEGTGKSMVFAGVGKAVKFLVEIPVSLMVGLLAYAMAPSGSHKLWWIIGLVLGLVLAHGVMEIIYQMDFKKFFSHWMELGIEAVLTAAVASIFVFDFIGYDTYMPKQEEIQSISFDSQQLTREMKIYLPENEEDIPAQVYDSENIWNRMQLEPDDSLYGLLGELVEKRRRFSWNGWEERYLRGGDTLSLSTIYHLSNGKNVKRNYEVKLDDEMRSALCALWKREDFRKGMYAGVDDTRFLKEINIDSWGNERELFAKNDSGRIEFVDALWQDIQEADMNTYLENPVGKIVLNYGRGEGVNENFVGNNDVILYPGYRRVMEILKEKGVSVSAHPDPDAITSIMVNDYRKASKSGEGIVETEVTGKKEIEQMLPLLYFGGYWSYQNGGEESDMNVVIEWKDQNGNPVETYFSFRRGMIPEEFA
ncbi:MAG: DUF6449 domain-containing protein [Blautia sp.]|jgi:ABC-2 type transport system permease protein